jgi:hypothetical protein
MKGTNMSKHRHSKVKRKTSGRATRILIGASLLTAALFGGLALHELRRVPARSASTAAAVAPSAEVIRKLPATATEQDRARFLAEAAKLGPVTAPTQAAPSLPPGYVPASAVASPPNDATPAVPTASQVPQKVDLSVENPGGVNGQRPSR